MTLCVIVSEETICFISTCTCSANRNRREIPSPLITENPKGPNIKKPICSFKINSTNTISDKNRRNCTNPKDDMFVILKENTTIGSGSKEKNREVMRRKINEMFQVYTILFILIYKFCLLKTFMINAILTFR